MAYTNQAASVNRDILISKLKLEEKSKNSIIFENNKYFVISPTMQNNNDRFDIILNNIEIARESKKKKLIIVRYKSILLLGNLVEFLDKMTPEEQLYPHKKTYKWQYTIKRDDQGYFIRLQGLPDSKFLLKEVNEAELLSYFNEIKDKENVNDSKGESDTYLDLNSLDLIKHIANYIQSRGFSYSLQQIQNLYLSLRSKPFVIISGISGTGKTKIVQLFAESIGATEENNQFKLIPVRPDWSDSSELLGYTDIKGDFVKGPLTKIVEQAHEMPNIPYFILLDEMNLARVEYYFSDVLSVMESRNKEVDRITSSQLIDMVDKSLTLPNNLYIIGTVNMDETTYPFSKKVLDRANTIEFNDIDLMNFASMSLNDIVEPIHVSNDSIKASYIHLIDIFHEHEPLIRKVSEKLVKINKILEPINAQVGYRVRDEIGFYLAHNSESGMLFSEEEAMDFCIMQKILPRVGGTENVVRQILNDLLNELERYPRSQNKVKEMLRRLDRDGFTSFWVS
ncbi:5-methylcytosine-specific restriction endonuclease McrBC GTP-binding regulatory subunit McrB [Ureibacillus xyleni]|uniref:5-methylcytosine-specific restriction endonuclease McrBC GTP-binding regulatory subunit McrB n=1 Tax=Ureibacillus xyleni TaxID=614648 RepID=A0A285SSH9_9BACL|nr:AAA family ATPase [Ureibacillus xyleni]SOC11363.1 5-methylcytosine-specific restriction endonuclease McrBC GTP-binding regulatory subunit McrB [Ureibacillus xyleni]